MTKRKVLENCLRFMARMVLKKYHPTIVGITGSVGKSSAKEAIALVLSREHTVRKSEGNYNNEIGIPLTIIGVKGGEASWLRWLGVFFSWLRMMVFPFRYPEILVLEIGIDHPGDMERLMSFVPVKVGVVTQVSSSHLAFFGTIGNIAKEKMKLITSLPEDGFAILNADDKRVQRMQEKTSAKTITYGLGTDAEMRADNLIFHREAKLVEGFSFKLNYDGKSIPVRLPKIVAAHHIAAALAAAAVGVAFKMNLVEIVSALEEFEPLPGRLRLLPGRDGIILLDDTYNASPISVVAALSVVKELVAPRKVIILGDMLELGADTETEHRALAEVVVASGAQIVVTVGQHMRSLHEALLAAGLSRRQSIWVPDPIMALAIVTDIVHHEDLILIKGSRGMRMEKITEALLVDPSEAKRLLCCQSPEWRERSFTPPAEWTEEMA